MRTNLARRLKRLIRLHFSPRRGFVCPVCLYDRLPMPPARELICRRCRTHFGYHDFNTSHGELRQEWLERADREARLRGVTAVYVLIALCALSGFLMHLLGR